MSGGEKDERAKREEFIAKRNELYERFLKVPAAIHLASEIRILDDKISEFTELIRKKKNEA